MVYNSKAENTGGGKRVGAHIFFWILVTLGSIYFGSLFGGSFFQNSIYLAAILPVQVLAAYLLVYIQIPRWWWKERIWKFVITSIPIAYLAAAIARWSVAQWAAPIIDPSLPIETFGQILQDPMYIIRVFLFIVYLPAGLLFLIKMARERFVQQALMDQLIQEKQATELSFLKAQMNPHFLFNTLNNIYSMAVRRADETPEMILRLSKILDYTLHECTAEKVPLVREWQFILDYCEMEVKRFGERVNLMIDQQIDDKEALISPLILVAIVENAFKYGLRRVKDPWVKIELNLIDGQMSLTVSNSHDTQESTTDTQKSSGIGVKNVRRQLELLYKDRYHMSAGPVNGSYLVQLKLAL